MTTVTKSAQIDAPAEAVWRVAGDPGRIADWLPALATSELNGDRRSCTLVDGGAIEERILEHSEAERRYRYEILDGPMPVSSYVSTLSVDGHDGHSHVSWKAEFEPEDPSQEAELREAFEQIYSEGLEALAQRVRGAD